MGEKILYGHKFEWEPQETWLKIDGVEYILPYEVNYVQDSSTYDGAVFIQRYVSGGEWIVNPLDPIPQWIGGDYDANVKVPRAEKNRRVTWIKREIVISGELDG